MDQKTSENDFFSPDALFVHCPWDLPTFSAEVSCSKRLKKPFWTRGPNPNKGPNHALENVLTNETPGLSFHRVNFVNPFQEFDKLLFRIDIPTIVNPFLL